MRHLRYDVYSLLIWHDQLYVIMELATISQTEEILDLYKTVIDAVNKSNVRLGWNIESYPNRDFIESSIINHELFVVMVDGKVVASAVLNNKMNDEYNEIPWEITDKPCTIHALATCPEFRGGSVSDAFLNDIEEYAKTKGYKSIHLDVIDTNTPAYHMYIRNGYKEVSRIQMYYEVVGTRLFWMMEKVLR